MCVGMHCSVPFSLKGLHSKQKDIIMTQTTLTVAETVAEKFNFSVDKFRLSGPDNMNTPFFGLFRSDTMRVVHDSSVT